MLWQGVELAVVQARESLGRVPSGTHMKMRELVDKNAIDIAFIDEREKVLQHDLNSFLEERLRFLPPELQAEFHKKMTSYDTEEAPFAMMLNASCMRVDELVDQLFESIKSLAIRYRYTPMNARTHGQEAEMQSFGKRCLTWYKDLDAAYDAFEHAKENLAFSKLSGAIGTGSGIDPDLESAALALLGFKPWRGATQIMPRVLYSPLGSALAEIVMVINKIATDIRLGARSGRPLWHEPFGKKQKGSSAMPHKKNTISCEQIEGMARMAKSYAAGIKENIVTWEERAIEQSSVERVFWPDLFHVTVRAISVLDKVLKGLAVYPDNMLAEIVESRGCYASNEAKELLVELGLPIGLAREDAYRIVQLAARNAFEPDEMALALRASPIPSLTEADSWLKRRADRLPVHVTSINGIIAEGALRYDPGLGAHDKIIGTWNEKLRAIFVFGAGRSEALEKWDAIFQPSHILANEAVLFESVFGV